MFYTFQYISYDCSSTAQSLRMGSSLKPGEERSVVLELRGTSLFVLLFQIKGMKERLDFWCGDVKNMAMLVEQQAHDILTWTSPPPVHRGMPRLLHDDFCFCIVSLSLGCSSCYRQRLFPSCKLHGGNLKNKQLVWTLLSFIWAIKKSIQHCFVQI